MADQRMDQRIDKWTRWIDGTIKNHVVRMHLRRHVWREVTDILLDNPELPASYWWEFMRDTYVSTQAIAVRRQADIHKDVASLAKLMVEISEDPAKITREFWIGLWADLDPHDEWYAEQSWMTYGGNVGDYLDPTIPTHDLGVLTTAAGDVKTYVDQHLAHAEASPAPASVTLTQGNIHDVIDVIGALFQKYYKLFTAAHLEVVPIIAHDWTDVFREPWIRPEDP